MCHSHLQDQYVLCLFADKRTDCVPNDRSCVLNRGFSNYEDLRP